jgi:hypothetical protein
MELNFFCSNLLRDPLLSTPASTEEGSTRSLDDMTRRGQNIITFFGLYRELNFAPPTRYSRVYRCSWEKSLRRNLLGDHGSYEKLIGSAQLPKILIAAMLSQDRNFPGILS